MGRASFPRGWAKKLASKVKAPLLWSSYGSFVLHLSIDKKWLAITVNPMGDRWAAIAVESGGGGNLEAVLNDHGHENLGLHANVADAISVSEKFGRAWLKGNSVKKCACIAIGKKPVSKGARRTSTRI